jgi:hypothetical protein
MKNEENITQLDQNQRDLFIGKYIQNFNLLEKELEWFIILFFKEHENESEVKAITKTSDSSKRNDSKATYFFTFAFTKVYDFSRKLDSFKYIMFLINPELFKSLDHKKYNYFALIKNLSEFRNLLAHANPIDTEHKFMYTKFKKPEYKEFEKTILNDKEELEDIKTLDFYFTYPLLTINSLEAKTIENQLFKSTELLRYINESMDLLNRDYKFTLKNNENFLITYNKKFNDKEVLSEIGVFSKIRIIQ